MELNSNWNEGLTEEDLRFIELISEEVEEAPKINEGLTEEDLGFIELISEENE